MFGVVRFHRWSARERRSTEAGSKSSRRRGVPPDGAVTMPANLTTSAFSTGRRTRNFNPSASSMASIFAPAPMPSRRRSAAGKTIWPLKETVRIDMRIPFSGSGCNGLPRLTWYGNRAVAPRRRHPRSPPLPSRALRRPQYPPRPQRQQDREQAEDRDVAIIDREGARPDRLEDADEKAAEKRARDRADAAENRRDQRLQAERSSIGIPDRAIEHRHDVAGEAGESARQREGLGENRAGIDAEHLRAQRIVGVGAPVAAEAAQRHQRDQRAAGRERERRRQQRVGRSRDDEIAGPRDAERRVEDRAHPLEARALRQAKELLHEQREPDRRDQHDLAGGSVQRLKHPAARRHSPGRGDEDGGHQRKGEKEGRGAAGEQTRAERGSIAARGRQFAEREIYAADKAIDQRIGRRQQRIDRRQRQSVDRLLQQIGRPRRKDRQRRDVAEGRGIGCASLRRRQPEANEKIALNFAQLNAVDLDVDQFRGAKRPPWRAKTALREMRGIDAAGIAREIVNLHPAPVGDLLLANDRQPRIGFGESGEGHAA